MSVLRSIGRFDFTSRSVFVRFVVLLALSTGLVAAALGAMSEMTIGRTAKRSVQSQAVEVTRLVGAQTGEGIMFGKGEIVESALGSLVESADSAVVGGMAIAANAGEIAFTGSEAARDELLSLATEAAATGEIAISADGFAVATPVRFGKDNAVVGALATAWTPVPLLAHIRGEELRTALVSLGVFAATLIVTGWVTRRTVTRPLLAVRAAMGRVASGDLTADVPEVERRDEIGAIAATLEEFRGSLREAERIGHEAAFKGAGFEGSSAPMMMADTDFNITFVNAAIKALFTEHVDEFRKRVPDFDPEDLVGKNMEVLHPDPSHKRALVADISKLPLSVDVQLGEACLTISVAAVLDADGNHLGVVAEWQDNTRTRRNSAILKALDSSQLWIDTDGAGAIVGVNRNFQELFHVEKDELVGRDGKDFLAPEGDVDAVRRQIEAAMSAGRTYSGRFHVTVGDARAVIEGTLTPVLDVQGRLSRRVLIANDVTAAQETIAAAEAERKASAHAQARVVEALGAALEQLSGGDMTASIDVQFAADYEQLREDFNRAIAKLLSAMRAVVEDSTAITGEVQGITLASNELSARTENQAATLEETAAALDELTASVKSSAERAAQAAQVVSDARSGAEASGSVVREAVEAMGEIEESSRQISKIIGVIDDIAFQTNLLALNAGVEAARAGDAGRGFAVVASEVRALAQRSSDAAREINGLISSSGAQVKRGVGLVGEAGKALEQIVASVAGIADHVDQMANSSSEQSQGLVEINQAMSQLDQVTQQNAAMFEETNAASQALSRAAGSLSETVGRFRTDKGSSAAPIPFPAAVRIASRTVETKRAKPASPVKHEPKVVNAASQFVPNEDDGWAEF